MKIIETIADLRRALTSSPHIGFVPTMGNLHHGHLSLVQRARERADTVITSIFVNPLQFAPHEDFATYPRTFEGDCDLLKQTGCDIVFAPSPREMFPEPQQCKVYPPTELAGMLEGLFRPGFFGGVATVVLKLFNIVQPGVAVFGKKDYQQLLIIKNMVREFALPIQIIAAETVRDPTGLALSSRNSYLNSDERVEAVQLQRTLREVSAQFIANKGRREDIERSALQTLEARGWQTDYVAIRRRQDLQIPQDRDELVILGAARLGATRLIDSIEI